MRGKARRRVIARYCEELQRCHAPQRACAGPRSEITHEANADITPILKHLNRLWLARSGQLPLLRSTLVLRFIMLCSINLGMYVAAQ